MPARTPGNPSRNGRQAGKSAERPSPKGGGRSGGSASRQPKSGGGSPQRKKSGSRRRRSVKPSEPHGLKFYTYAAIVCFAVSAMLVGAYYWRPISVKLDLARLKTFFSGDPESTPKTPQPSAKPPSKPAVPQRQPESRPGPKDSKSDTNGGPPYEEKQRLDVLLKKLDQRIYGALTDGLKIRDEAIHFLEITHRQSGDQNWDHALIEVEAPPSTESGALVQLFQRRFGEFPAEARVRAAARDKQTAAVFVGDLHTHTLRLMPTPPVVANYIPDAPPPKPPLPPLPETGRPAAAIVIDDFGLSPEQAECFIEAGLPLAVSVLPHLAHSRNIAKRAHEKGMPVLLHLPMQPKNWPETDPGPGALMANMDKQEIQTRVEAALDAVPHAVGVNNHMGSQFVEDRERVRWVLEVLRKRGLFVLDSRTSASSFLLEEARRMNLPALERTIFLDNVQEPDAIRVQLRKLAAQAGHNGRTVGIGHVYPITCQVLKNDYNYLKSKVDFIPITKLIP